MMLWLAHLLDVLALFIFTLFFFFQDPATTELYTLSLHDALPILARARISGVTAWTSTSKISAAVCLWMSPPALDRKSTRLNSSHTVISYAVFCLKKKIKKYSIKDRNQRSMYRGWILL